MGHHRNPLASTNAVWAVPCLLAWVALAGAIAAPPEIPSQVKASLRNRVNFGYNVGIIVGMVNPDGRRFFQHGRIALDGSGAPTPDTLYEIGSVTKVFTATLLADAVGRGEVTLATAVADLLPDTVTLPQFGRTGFTVEHLATHASGLPNNLPFNEDTNPINPFAAQDRDLLYGFLGDYQLSRRPGTQWEYSNLGMGLLGHGIALNAGLAFEAALHERILSPLGLSDTGMTLTEEQVERRAPGYSGVVFRPPFEMTLELAGAGLLVSSANDMLTFLEHQLGIRQSGPSLTEAMALTRESHFRTPEIDMGLGWLRLTAGRDRILFHDGATMGHNAFLGFHPERQTGVVVLANARINSYAGIQDLGLKCLLPVVPLAIIPRPAGIPEGTLETLAGRYVGSEGDAFEFRVLEDHLVVEYSEDRGAAFTMYPRNPTRFQLVELTGEAFANFRLDDEGLPTRMTWELAGQSQSYWRVAPPPSVRLRIAASGVEVWLEGETTQGFTIEVSDDLPRWSPLDSQGPAAPSILDAFQTDRPHRFYRARLGP